MMLLSGYTYARRRIDRIVEGINHRCGVNWIWQQPGRDSDSSAVSLPDIISKGTFSLLIRQQMFYDWYIRASLILPDHPNVWVERLLRDGRFEVLNFLTLVLVTNQGFDAYDLIIGLKWLPFIYRSCILPLWSRTCPVTSRFVTLIPPASGHTSTSKLRLRSNSGEHATLVSRDAFEPAHSLPKKHHSLISPSPTTLFYAWPTCSYQLDRVYI
jgi:hypothetical protein